MPCRAPRFLRRHLTYRLLVILIVLVSLIGALFVFSTYLSATPSLKPKASVPHLVISKAPPPVTAKNYLILDPENKLVVYQQAAQDPIYPASTTKLLTALTALDYFGLEDSFVVSRSYPEGQDLGFVPGEKVTVYELLYAMLIQSANDAAEILAENYPKGRQAFIDAMNLKALTLNLRHTHFKNPTGLDEDGHLSTATDLARLAIAALKNPVISRIVSSENAVISQTHILTNTNELLGKVPGVLGIKTGFTNKAGQALISYVSRDGRPLIFVVLGSKDRLSDSALLIEWAYSSVTWEE